MSDEKPEYKYRQHHWQESDSCGLCRGEGRISIVWKFSMEERGNGFIEIRDLVSVNPYSKPAGNLADNHYAALYRCQCPLGTSSTIPISWSRLTRESQTRVERWL